jgi:restriction system protein
MSQMARRSKKKKEMDFLQGLILISMFASFYFVFNWTKSMRAGVIAAGCALGIVLAIIIYRNMLYREKLKKSGIHNIDKMDGREFEQYLGILFKEHGYLVNVTKASGDYGADLVISKDGRKIVVQAKRYSKNVGLKAVQEAQASIAHYNASEAWVVSNSDYTAAAYILAKSNKVRLITRNELIEMILKMNPGTALVVPVKELITIAPREQIQKQTIDPIIEDVTCSRCGANMIRRIGPRGEFLGCGNFPKCRNTITLSVI